MLEYWVVVAIRITPLLQHSNAEIAGVVELADALDSKSTVMLGRDTAIATCRHFSNKPRASFTGTRQNRF